MPSTAHWESLTWHVTSADQLVLECREALGKAFLRTKTEPYKASILFPSLERPCLPVIMRGDNASTPNMAGNSDKKWWWNQWAKDPSSGCPAPSGTLLMWDHNCPNNLCHFYLGVLLPADQSMIPDYLIKWEIKFSYIKIKVSMRMKVRILNLFYETFISY